MTKITGSSIKKPAFKLHMTLFWRLFLSLLSMILITSALSIVVERWLNEQELATRMDRQVDSLMAKREQLVTHLQNSDMSAVKQMYQQDRRLMAQIRVYDEQGSIIYPRYRYREERQEGRQSIDSQASDSEKSTLSGNRNLNSNQLNSGEIDRYESDYSKFSNKERANRNPYSNNDVNVDGSNIDKPDAKPFILNDILQPMPMPPHRAITDIDSRPELADVTVTLSDGQTFIIQLRPHLLFKDVLELQRGNFTVRLGLIILFSVLVCFWLSRTMTKRIRRVQQAVHRMMVGDYQANPILSTLGTDELGLLAKDVAQLSTRLADSELARKQMLSDISHELRSPLARLDVATELTRDFAPQASRYLDRIDKESARMNELIEQIIRIQSLQMQQYTTDSLENGIVNIPEIISEIGQDVCFEFQHKQVRWQWQPPTRSAWSVLGNHDQLYSALENIIRNAFMHTPPNSTVMAEVNKVQMDDKKDAIQISIIDEGGGIADKDLERIFQPFVRLDTARHRQTGGYGLGLAIVQAVVSAHKGQVHVDNRSDGIKGLVLQVTLPI